MGLQTASYISVSALAHILNIIWTSFVQIPQFVLLMDQYCLDPNDIYGSTPSVWKNAVAAFGSSTHIESAFLDTWNVVKLWAHDVYSILSHFFNEQWIAIIVGAAGLLVYDVVKGIIRIRTPKSRQYSSRRAASVLLRRYFATELSLLRAWPSLIAASTIDFSSDYVSLVLVEQARANPVRAKRSISVDDILSSPNPVAIVSGPGCGKTTLLLRMEYELLVRCRRSLRLRHRSVPVFLRAREIIGRPKTIYMSIIDHLSRDMASADASHFVEVALTKGWCCILIDGLDEIESGLPSFIQEIRIFKETYPHTHVVLSSRPISYDLSALMAPGSHTFMEVAIAPLTIEKKRALIEKYAPDRRSAAAIIDMIVKTPFLAEITAVTINVILLIESFSFAGELKTRADFYQHATHVLLSAMPERKGYNLSYTSNVKIKLLSCASFNTIFDNVPISRQSILEHITMSSAPCELVFSEVLRTSGLLRLISLDRYDFPHRTFLEYFTSIEVNRQFDFLAPNRWDSMFSGRLNEVVAFVSNIRDNVDALLEHALARDCDKPLIFSICLSECKNVSAHYQVIAEELIWSYLRTARDLLAQDSLARRILSRIHNFPRPTGFVTIYDRLMAQLEFPERSVPSQFTTIEDAQADAFKYLLHTRGMQIVPRLTAILTNPNAEGWARFKAGELLAGLAREDLVRDFEEGYRTNWDDDVRRFIVEGLVRTRSKNALPALERAATDTDFTIRDLAIEGISYIKERRFLEDATLVRVSPTSSQEKMILAGCDLTPEEALEVALDRTSVYRLDAFFRLREGCPSVAGTQLTALAIDLSENNFFRAESVKLIGTQSDADFFMKLAAIFAAFDPAQAENGVGTRGYAIEYLAYRKHRATLQCIADNDLTKRTANERTKVFWSVNEILSDLTLEEFEPFRNIVIKLCNDNTSEPYQRLHHWRIKIEQQIAAKFATKIVLQEKL